MLLAYNSIFLGMPYITLAFVTLILGSALIFRSSLIGRSFLYSFGLWLAPAFYIAYLFISGQPSPEILLALFIDSTILACYLSLFPVLLSVVSNRSSSEFDLPQYRRWLKIAIVLKIVLITPLLLGGGFGIFSIGSRLDYLVDSRWNLYLTYGLYLIDVIAMPVAAAMINCQKKWGGLVLGYLGCMATVSVVSGSKGSGILALLGLLSLLKFDSASEYVRLLRVPVVAIAAIFGSTVYYVGKFLSLTPLNLTSLMFSRVFLNNDGRALAIDYASYLHQDGTSLFRESFRFLSTVLGNPPANAPLGELLYQEAFSVNGLSGANTSSTALFMVYGGEIEKVLFLLGICLLSVGIALAVRRVNSYSIVTVPIALALLSLLSQDFLAFQVIVNLLIMLSIVLLAALASRVLLRMATAAPVS